MGTARDVRSRTSVSNVLVIGTGAAGLRAAIAAHEAGCEVTVIGKRARKDAHSVLAAGGINAVLGTRDPEDSWEQHFADTLREGYFLERSRASSRSMAREAPRAIQELPMHGAVEFARTADGRIDQRYFGAHTYRRTCYAGDYTGRAMITDAGARGSPISASRSWMASTSRACWSMTEPASAPMHST